MGLNSLTAISPIDGRYRKVTNELAPYFYEFADMTGKIIYNSKTSSLLEIVSGTDFVNGAYLLQVYNFDFSKYYSKMIIIQH